MSFADRFSLAGVLILLSGSVASAGTFNFNGVFTADDDQAAFNIVLNSASTITLSTSSSAGGGFPTVLSLFGPLPDSDPPVIVYSTNPGNDANLTYGVLSAGTYLVILTQQSNTPTGGTNLNDPGLWVDPPGTGNFTPGVAGGGTGPFVDPFDPNHNFTGNWAVEFDNVDSASLVGAPEPGTILSLMGGLGLLAVFRRRRSLLAKPFTCAHQSAMASTAGRVR